MTPTNRPALISFILGLISALQLASILFGGPADTIVDLLGRILPFFDFV